MKIMRRLPLALIATGIVVLLSSCNAMLDTIYPTRQIISVDVELTFPSAYVNVQLLDSSANPLSSVAANAPSSVDAHGIYHYYFQFTKLKNATYGLLTYAQGTGRPATYYFYDPANYYTFSVSVPYYQSSDITDLVVAP